MKKHPNKFEGVRLTNDIPVAEWIASFPTESAEFNLQMQQNSD